MRIKEGFRLRSVMGQTAIVGEGINQMNFNKLIVLNSSAEYLWKAIEGNDFDVSTLTDLLIRKYDVDINIATNSAEKIVSQWLKIGLIE